jgi:RNA polymerase sigma factor (sigma-70 family)
LRTQWHHLSDEELVSLYKEASHKDALGILFERYHHLIATVCYKYYNDSDSARDASMQIFERLITLLPKHEVVNFKAWLLTVSKNHCLMDLRKRKVNVVHVEYLENIDVENESNLHLLQVKERNLERMMEGLGQLDEKQRTCLELFYLKDMSYTAIQEQTGFTFMEVKSFIQNGKRKLKILLEEKIERSE